MKYTIAAIVTFIAVALFVFWTGPESATADPGSTSKSACVSGQKEPPVRMEASGPDKTLPGSTVEISLKILRKSVTTVPMELKIELPAGATLENGEVTETLVDDTNSVIERKYRVRIDSVPNKDVTFELLLGTGPLVTRSEAAYRFGRPEPRIAVPKFDRPVIINNVQLMTPVVATPREKAE